ncbi:hypothetical protein POPTR_019G014310v4 [Populus trichocarpa]|uniref:Uncharacterized protein n=1 Tax=Populus trichocarpa TaxID=3694 RepID=A0ACC0RKD5_POPTR|nr:hypothetical protein POPTR_019G014310v4 [Populus trichocarpa]
MDSEFLAIKWLSKQLILSFISINASTNIWKCYNMESLVSSSWLCSAPPSSPSYHGIFLFLKSLICDSLQQIGITNCQMLKRLAIHLPLLENGQLSHPPSLRVMEYIQKNGESQWWNGSILMLRMSFVPLLFK